LSCGKTSETLCQDIADTASPDGFW
jgi:hypothetical protein